jgi:hypothetical protein
LGSLSLAPHRRQRALHVGIDTVSAALATVDHGLDAFTIHDLRSTMRTHLSSLGVRSEVAERCLNHKLPGIQAVYNTHAFLRSAARRSKPGLRCCSRSSAVNEKLRPCDPVARTRDAGLGNSNA